MTKAQIIFVFSVFMVVVSCQRKTEKNQNKIFTYNETTGVSSLDPIQAKNQANMWPVHQLYNTLLEVDENMNFKPSIAKSWFFESNGKSIAFTLRNDVYFHDDPVFTNGKGRRLNASDVCFSLSRLIDPKSASPGAWVLNELVDSIHPFSAPNDSVFILALRKPLSSILGLLTMPYCSILPKEAVEKYGNELARHPVGTGPFRFLSWHENQAITLTKNDHYFEKDSSGKQLPYLDGVQITFLPGKSAEFIAFQQKKIDFINDIDPSFKDEMLTKTGKLKRKWEGLITLKKSEYLNTEYLGINMNVPKQSSFSDIHFRKAINHAIDRKKLLFYLRNSIGFPANKGFVPAGLNAFYGKESRDLYNPNLSKKHLDSSGYLLSNPSTIVLSTVPTYASLGSFIVSELKKVGIDSRVDVVQKSVLLDQMSSGNILFFRGSWIADYPDPINYFSVLYGKNPSPPNYTRFKNDRFDFLFESAQSELSQSKRDSLYNMMESIINEEVPLIPLWYDQVLHFYQNNLINMKPNPLNMLELKKVSKK
jgi:peptide/nickel transport system substrate-binding protein